VPPAPRSPYKPFDPATLRRPLPPAFQRSLGPPVQSCAHHRLRRLAASPGTGVRFEAVKRRLTTCLAHVVNYVKYYVGVKRRLTGRLAWWHGRVYARCVRSVQLCRSRVAAASPSRARMLACSRSLTSVPCRHKKSPAARGCGA